MANKTTFHSPTHLATETSLASCLAATDNRLPVFVPVDGECRLCCCTCVGALSLCACANEQREHGACLWVLCSGKMTEVSYFFRRPLCVLLNSTNVV